ncbi:tRNA preQ1(34) S-adenosylmethionine ribosyltransferase-isomerase QueA [Candidatus Chrysopegis kryptomonas]|uniref:S-adenosylmethionine:tRNA ribosyltransferase-isomerase n=1 Tax=Candidatus Chryseopegocella kryptomonas TaxID=1633643 RepID=A0A0P1NW54_9BACT|nr:tRNA preQ1(34) S-adenosylmethionine ribosyltransferase-isomerase QueA [Candidatus Chrysopegis kryptomonas]CUT03562.1 S-adenosylmethionine:tRNA ribosyltransferase-isomerase [Candidatus Chrysopegis kryptomonas]
MKLSDFNYQLPKNLIAKYPVEPRDSARLLVLDRKNKTIEDKVFTDIIDYLEEGDSLVLNKTKVFPARLIGRKEKTGAKIEILLLRELNPEEHLWDVLVEPARKVRIGNKIYFGDNNEVYCEVIDNTTSRGRTLKFHYEGDFFKFIEKYGQVPLPPYIKRQPEEGDKEWYQTVYAEVVGSVAAPTAGLHLSKKMLKRIEKERVKNVPIVLHIGIGTFRKVEVEDLSKHRMDSEYFEIPAESARLINETIDKKKSVVAVGTSVVRALESSVSADGHVKPYKGWTDKFIYPPYEFKIVNKLITNFHAPESTPLMLVAAFAGLDFLMQAYKHAIKNGYRFLSYGDAMLII